MDAATRSTSTLLGQVENPILNAFVSEYFLGPGKRRFCCGSIICTQAIVFVIFIKLLDSAIHAEEKT